MLSPALADIIGIAGSALMVLAYAYSNMAKRIDFLFFNSLNLIGSLLLIVSLTVHYNMASMALEIIWAAIALIGLVRTFGRRRA